MREAAVMIIQQVRDCGLALLCIQRATHLRRHAGEVGFPGGAYEPGDDNLLETALRETAEEVGIGRDCLSAPTFLNRSRTRQGQWVSAYVADLLPKALALQLCPHEIAEAFWLPVPWLLQDLRHETQVFAVEGTEYWAPVYRYQRFTLWGFSSRLAITYLQHYHGRMLTREHSSPERYR